MHQGFFLGIQVVDILGENGENLQGGLQYAGSVILFDQIPAIGSPIKNRVGSLLIEAEV